MEAISRNKRANRQNTATMLGTTTNIPNYNSGQRQLNATLGEMAKLPTKPAGTIQDLDPASPTFGQFTFTVGFDMVGGGSPLG